MKHFGKSLILLFALFAAYCSSSNPSGLDAGPDGNFFTDAEDGADGGSGENPALNCSEYFFENVFIPMRDGKTLAAFVRRPVNPDCRVPTILLQTPYDKENARKMWFIHPENEPLFASTDYAFVVVDWRGFFGSKDAAVSGSPPYAQDGYDTVEWIAAQPWSNGKVGTWGVSALCQQQWRTAVQKPPHLAAMVPIFCQANQTYEQYYPGGVLRKEYFDFISNYFGAELVKQHPLRDSLWRAVEGLVDLSAVSAPALVVAGWYDLFNAGTLRDFSTVQWLSDEAVRDKHRLLIGPWIHFAVGGETSGAGRELDEQEKLYVDWQKIIQKESLLFFDLHLRGQNNAASSWPAARWILGGAGGEESGASWPPSGSSLVYYLTADGTLAEIPPQTGQRDFVCDPDNPSPTVGGQTLLPTLTHGPRWQDAVIERQDALVFAGPVLGSPLTIRGAVKVLLDVATTGADTDFAVRLTDVNEEGRHLLVADGIRRLKLRDDYSKVSTVEAAKRYTIEIPVINELGYVFAAGHRVGLIVSGNNYPRFERNPQNGQDFYTDAASSVTATNTVFLDGNSRLILPLGK